MKLGMNLSTPNYGRTFLPFTDLRLGGPGWHNVPAPGWPIGKSQLPPGGLNPPAETFPCTYGYFRPGTYTLSARGMGEILVRSNDLPGGRLACTFGSGQSAWPVPIHTQGDYPMFDVLVNDVRNQKTCLSNLQFLAPGAPGPGLDWSAYWDAGYLASHGSWTGPLRSLDWLGSSGSPVTTWASREPRAAIGVEGLVDLSNRTGKDVWFNLPVRTLTASGFTDYPTQLGAYLARHADPSRTYWIEIGDEIGWNWSGSYAADTNYLSSIAPSLCDPVTGKNLGLPKWTGALAYATYYAAQAIRAQIDPAKGPAIKTVLCGQCTWIGNSVAYPVHWSQVNGWSFDAVACAPYANWPDSGPYTTAALAALVAAGDLAGAMDLLVAGLQAYFASVILPCVQDWRGHADSWGVPLYLYEMGFDYRGCWTDPATAAACQAMVNDQRGADLVNWYLGQLAPYAAMGCWYADCRRDEWGSKQYADDAASRVRTALEAYAAANP